MSKSEELFYRAKKRIPGGVNSPVRAFNSVGLTPRFISKADGSHIWDLEGKEYVDFVGSWGPMILGHNHPSVREAIEKALVDGTSFGAATEREVMLAEMICESIPGIDMIRMVNSGTEAVMSAIRLARAFTGRDKIIKFAGCYHGHSDSMLVSAGSGLMTQGIPDSPGVTSSVAGDTLIAAYNDFNGIKELFDRYPSQIAAIIVEPVAANMGVVLPEEGFLKLLRELSDKNGSLLIFDEVITGFRLAFGGAMEYLGVTADLCTYGKIIGGGLPVGAYGGKEEIMRMVAPSGKVYQAGTLSGNPLAMAAGIAQLSILKKKDFYDKLNKKADTFFEELADIIKPYKEYVSLNHIGTLGSIFFTGEKVLSHEIAVKADTVRFGDYFRNLLEEGLYIAPSQFEALFLSAAHTDEDLDRLKDSVKGYFKGIFNE